MSLAGRLVPWASWDEWEQVGRYLFDEKDHDVVRKGLAMVAAWRIRGRVPVGVDATANLREIQLNEPGMSDQLMRLQYSISIVRFVNGVVDSAQKGRVAASVSGLAGKVGIPRILVDIRHESTHNELPTLSTLRIGSRLALEWLRKRYWTAQKRHILDSKAKVRQVFDTYVESHVLAASREDSAAEGEVKVEYDVRKSKKERQALLNELRSKVPGGAEDILVEACQQSACKDDTNKAIMIGCGRAMKHISDEWKNMPSILVHDYIENLFQSLVGADVSERNPVWFQVALDVIDTAILVSLLRELVVKHANDVYKKRMILFIDVVVDAEFETSVDLLKSACDRCIQKGDQNDLDFLQEFVSLFLTVPTTQDLLEGMGTYIEKIQPKEKKRKRGWSKVEDWTPCAIGMIPSSYSTNGTLPRLFVPEDLSSKGPFDNSEDGDGNGDETQLQEDIAVPQTQQEDDKTQTCSVSSGYIDESDGACLPPSADFFHSKSTRNKHNQ